MRLLLMLTRGQALALTAEAGENGNQMRLGAFQPPNCKTIREC
jgi:hypothetical protein